MADDEARPSLRFLYSRRTFWRALLQEALVASGVIHGGRECSLEDLGRLPDEELAQIRPIVHPACQIFVDGDDVWSRHRGTGEAARLFRADDAGNRVALGMFDGERTLGEIGISLAQALEQDEEWGFARARGLFLFLANRLVCIPKNPPSGED
ncbi:MAG: hypothetical protein P8129_15680 [Anaerolineae bacterium]